MMSFITIMMESIDVKTLTKGVDDDDDDDDDYF